MEPGFISLMGAVMIARGTERACYVHPGDPTMCIKVSTTSRGRQQQRERRYFRALVRRNVRSRHIVEHHGEVETEHGLGLVFSLVRDYDGAVSSDVTTFVQAHGTRGIAEAFEALRGDLLAHCIIACDMSLENFLVRRTAPDAFEIVMVDGLGNREFIPISSLFECCARLKMRRRWKRFARKIAGLIPPER
jgi:hypothetical protein